MNQNNGQPDLHVFPSGAVRNKDGIKERYDLFSPIAMEALALVFGEGAENYPPWNWENGMSISFLVNRGLRHWRLYASGDRSEDHLAKCEWAFHAARHSETMWPHLNQDLRRSVDGQLCIPPNVDNATAAEWKKFENAMAGLRKEYRETEGKGESAVEYPIGSDGRGLPPRVHTYPAAKVPTRYYLMADPSERIRMAGYRSDLQWWGHEVVSRWIDLTGIALGEDELDVMSCEVVIIFAKCADAAKDDIEYARGFHKQVVVIGSICPPGFPEHGKPERWFPGWDAFLKSLSSPRAANGVASFL